MCVGKAWLDFGRKGPLLGWFGGKWKGGSLGIRLEKDWGRQKE